MARVQIKYQSISDTFLADDGFGNQITYKADRTQNQLATSSNGASLGPMISLLMAMGACSGIDIVIILGKQKLAFDELSITIDAEREQDKEPALWVNAQVHFQVSGAVPLNKLERAASLSIEKYCSVAETLRRAGCVITHAVSVN